MIRKFEIKRIYRFLFILITLYVVYQTDTPLEAAAHLNSDIDAAPTIAADIVENDWDTNFTHHIPYTTTLTFTPTTTYLSNPAIGWQEGTTPDNPLLPETVVYRRSSYNWRDQNPDEGDFDWSEVDADLAAAVAEGKQFSFRIYTMRGVPYDSHQMPDWVVAKGVETLLTNEPDYANCDYQKYWAEFVQAMRRQYDGNPHIAFIDISGYGNFNEWNWRDDRTEWGDTSLDAHARQRLADMFIGGQATIECWDSNEQIHSREYNYPGFQETQLLMPYAGIRKSSEYVANRRSDVGIRHDCLGGSPADGMRDHIGHVVSKTWPTAPIIYEFCAGSTADPTYIQNAEDILQWTHGSMVHDNFDGNADVDILTDLLKFAGYRFALKQVTYPTTIVLDQDFTLSMIWHNNGYAPVYPKMGQDFELHFYLVAADGTVAQDWPIEADIATWLPADPLPGVPPDNLVTQTLPTPANLPVGQYTTMVAIIDKRTGQPINLAFEERDVDIASQTDQGRYRVGQITISETSDPPPSDNDDQRQVYLPFIVVE